MEQANETVNNHAWVYRYGPDGKLMGAMDVSDWTDKEIELLVSAINSRPDGSVGVIKNKAHR